jgi:hypothetical protein
MTKDIIITSIAKNEQLKAYARKTTKGNILWEDIIAEMILYLIEMPEDRFISIYRSEGLQSYCYKIIHLSWNSVYSPFYKKYLTEEPKTDNVTFDYNYEIDILYDKAVIEVKNLKYDVSKSGLPTKAILFDSYLKHGSYRKVAKEFDIPTMTIYNIINGIKEQIISKL